MQHLLSNLLRTSIVGCLLTMLISSSQAETPVSEELSLEIPSALLTHFPTRYVDEKEWGKRKEVFDGVKFEGSGLKIKLKKKTKLEEHGTWKRYKAWCEDVQRDVALEMIWLPTEDDSPAQFKLVGKARIMGEAEIQQWNRGIKVLGVSAVAEFFLTFELQGKLNILVDGYGWLSEVSMKPIITGTDIELVEFRLDRIGAAKGAIIREIGEEFEDRIRRELDKKEAKITDKANQILEKHFSQEKFEFSAAKSIQSLGHTIIERLEQEDPPE